MLLAALLLAATATAWAAPQAADPGEPIDSGWVLRILARPAPMRTNFVELRSSRLLKEPLRLSGEYQRPDEATLVRQVRAPYVETTTITTDAAGGGQATIERKGKSARTFPLSRVPELARLRDSFGALLSGDRAALERHYEISAEGTRRSWQMTLVPKDAELAAKLRDIRMYGRGIELRCIETHPVQGDMQRTLLAGAARTAHDVSGTDDLVALCHGDQAP
ncbi:LolA-related protein [Luteimonas lutimaris]|nr:LolA-related protein [Luteimonas sp.]